VHERNHVAATPAARGLVDQSHPAFFELGERALEVRDLVSDVMEPLATLGNEPADGGVGSGRS
jgi:hypothetical protein